MGKTSLIHVAIHDSEVIQKDYLTFFFDILQTNTLSEFTYLLGKAVFNTIKNTGINRVQGFLAALKSLKGSFGFDPITGLPSFDIQLGDIKNPEYTLEEIFFYLEQNEKPVIMVIDEFQQITKYPEKNTEAILRSHMQQMSNTTFVYAGSERTILQEMFISSKRPFYNSAEIMHLGPINEDVYVEFAHSLFTERSRIIDSEPIRDTFKLFEGNTFYMQRTMNAAFADTPKKAVCNEDTIKRSIYSLLTSSEVIYREILSNIPAAAKLTLYAIAKDKVAKSPLSGTFINKHALPSASSVQNSLQRLMKSGLISRSEDGYAMTDPLFRIFINSLYATPEI